MLKRQGLKVKYVKNKKKVIVFYLLWFLIGAVFFALIPFLVFEKSLALRAFLIGEGSLIAVSLSLIKSVKAELNQSIVLHEDFIECNNFFVKGAIMDGKIKYNEIKELKLKGLSLPLFSKYILICVPNNPPAVVKQDFINYKELWQKICENCKNANPDLKIDNSIYEYLIK